MKIIGRSGDDYIVSISESEISLAMGFDRYAGEGFRKHTANARELNSRENRAPLRAGTKLDVIQAHDFFDRLVAKTKELAQLGATFRAVGDLIETPAAVLERIIIPPPEPEPEPVEPAASAAST